MGTLHYYRKCPECGRDVWHASKATRDKAANQNQLCQSCGHKGIRTIVSGDFYKKCSNCQAMKPAETFNKHVRSFDGLQGHCRSCANLVSLEYYYSHKGELREASKERMAVIRGRVDALKSVPCTDCGESLPIVCMDFDHLPEFAKMHSISEMLRRRYAWALIEEEIAKCEVVCANCHRIRTSSRVQGAHLAARQLYEDDEDTGSGGRWPETPGQFSLFAEIPT